MNISKRAVIIVVAVILIVLCLSTSDHARQVSPCPKPETIIYPMTNDLRPIIRKRESAEYTVKARDNKIQGTVILQVVFHESGQVQNIRVVQGLPHGLTQQAIGRAYEILFTPAMKDGKPVSIRGSLEYTFKLY